MAGKRGHPRKSDGNLDWNAAAPWRVDGYASRGSKWLLRLMPATLDFEYRSCKQFLEKKKRRQVQHSEAIRKVQLALGRLRSFSDAGWPVVDLSDFGEIEDGVKQRGAMVPYCLDIAHATKDRESVNSVTSAKVDFDHKFYGLLFAALADRAGKHGKHDVALEHAVRTVLGMLDNAPAEMFSQNVKSTRLRTQFMEAVWLDAGLPERGSPDGRRRWLSKYLKSLDISAQNSS